MENGVRGLLLLCVASLSGCGYNTLQQQDEQVRTSWSEVVSQYQRRADLVASLATTMKGFADSSEAGAVGLSENRARSGAAPAATGALNDPVAFASYQALQDQLSRSLRELMGVSATYPQLQMDADFRDLKAQLAETEARIAEARDRYAQATRDFNTTVRSFPTDLTARMFDFRPKPDLAGVGAPAGAPAMSPNPAPVVRTTPARSTGGG